MGRRVILIFGLALFSAITSFAQLQDVAAKLGYPQIIVYNGKVITMDDASMGPQVGTIAQAMAIREGRVLATGTTAEIRALAGPQTTLINLKGRAVMPGLISTHEHPLDSWIWFDPRAFRHALPNDDRVIIRWMDYMPPKEQLARFEPMVRQLVAKAKPGQGIMIYFNDGVNGEWSRELGQLLRNSVKKEWLDQLAPNHPMMVGSPAGIFNQKALDELARVHPEITDIKRPNFNQLVNVGEGARDFATSRWFETDVMLQGDLRALAKIYKAELEHWASYGFTAFASGSYATNNFRGVSYLDSRGEMPVRMGLGYMGPDFDEETLRWLAGMTGYGTDHVWLVGMWERIGMDCSAAPIRPAWLEKHRTAERGARVCNFDPGTPGREILERMIETGNRIATMHTWGDKDIDNFMDAIEAASKRAGMTLEEIRAKRHALDHSINGPRLDQIPRLKKLGIVVSVNHQRLDIGAAAQVAEIYGIEYTSHLGPMRSLAEAGVPASFEVDNEYPDRAFYYMTVGMNRRSGLDGKTYGPDQKVDRTIMLKAMTRWGAHYLLRENKIGSLEPGKFADFIILDQDILTVPEEKIPNTKVLMTVLGGETTHLAASLASELGMQPVGATTWPEPFPKGWEGGRQ